MIYCIKICLHPISYMFRWLIILWFFALCPHPSVEDKIVDPVSQLETVNKPVVMSATSSSEGKNQFGQSTETQKDVAMDDVISSKMRSKASDASVQGGILFLLLKLGFTGKLYPIRDYSCYYCDLVVSLASKISIGTFRL